MTTTKALAERNSIGDERVSAEHWWNGTEWEKPKYWEMNLSHSRLIHRNSHMAWPGLELGPGLHDGRPTTNRLSLELGH